MVNQTATFVVVVFLSLKSVAKKCNEDYYFSELELANHITLQACNKTYQEAAFND